MKKETIKDIALELLELYASAQQDLICEYSGNIQKSTEALQEKVDEYRRRITEAKDG